MLTAKQLAKLEPWRQRQGQPRSALQIDWLEPPTTCNGDLEFDPPEVGKANRWWRCIACGYCSSFTNMTHAVPVHPQDYFSASLELFYKVRKGQGLTHEQAKAQAGHLLGSVLRSAAKLRPDDLGRYIEEHVLIKE